MKMIMTTKSLIGRRFIFLLRSFAVTKHKDHIRIPTYRFSTSSLKFNPRLTLRAAPVEVPMKSIMSQSELLEILVTDNDPDRLLQNIQSNMDLVEGQHIVTALKSMQQFYKENRHITFEEVKKSIHFNKMLMILEKNMTRLSLPQVVQTFRVLQFFKVQSNSNIFQSILQLIRNSINELELNHIYSLNNRLKTMNPTFLSEAIRTALPEVFKAQVMLKVDRDHVNELKSALWYMTEEKIQNEQILNYIFDGLEKHKTNLNPIAAKHIYLSMCSLEPISPKHMDIVIAAQNLILDNCEMFKTHEKVCIVIETLKMVASGKEEFYNPILIDNLLKHCIQEDLDYKPAMYILNSLNKLHHINQHLLEYLSHICCENPPLLNTHPLNVSTLLHGLSNANYKPSSWKKLQKVSLEHIYLLPNDVTLAYCALHLLALDCFDSKLISHIFAIHQIPRFLSPTYHKTLATLYQSVKTLYPEYTGPWPENKLIDSFKTIFSSNETKQNLLLPLLQHIVGTPNCIKNNVKTELGHNIDHLVILQNDKPIAINSTSTDSGESPRIQDLIIPEDCTRVAIMIQPTELFGRNIKVLRASVLLSLRSLEAMSYKVVKVSEELWQSMPEYERIPYLKTEIGLK
ncbi:uncharacterized protein LOC106650573 [Trichogramma pretiosum]|uniref:uncharacterized protein LOC106650573 n=1 Tax=Trichogramma pretiosum TaxID=7493 RepID=UPI0006C9C8DD|nr:uncharacterized protein LOC106650573 [Trichogramma pretiosum]